MQRIVPHLWFDTQAVEAANFYASVFPDSKVLSKTVIKDTPSGDCDIVSFEVCGFQCMSISAGPVFTMNPSISFHVRCRTPEEVDEIWNKISPEGTALMELGEYPFSKRYGWIQDKYGVSWQIIHTNEDFTQRIVPALLFTQDRFGKAEEAINFYASTFPNSTVEAIDRYVKGDYDQEGYIKYSKLMLNGEEFVVMESSLGHKFTFNEGISLMVNCKDQQEIDHYWEKLSAVPEAEQCGWLKDKYGVSWQILPTKMGDLMGKNPEKTTPAMLKMKKILIEDLEKVAEA